MEYRRAWVPGGCYFFTLVTEQRRPLLVTHIELLRSALRRVKQQQPFAIDAMVVLPDHLHCILRLPEGDTNYPQRWSLIKRYFSSSLPNLADRDSLRNKRERGIWQRRYWEHSIHTCDDWNRHMDYIHFNPVKHGYVQNPEDWPFSSFQRCLEKGWYRRDWTMT